MSKYRLFLNNIISNNSLYLNSEDIINLFYNHLNLRRYNEHRTININRLKAADFIEKYNKNPEKVSDFELKETIFGQVFQSLKDMKGENFFLNKNGRLFKVNLIGENATDAGGPYHEIISSMCKDLESGYINLFIKTPNNNSDKDYLQDKYLVNPYCNKDIHKKAYEFIGKLMVTAISSGEVLNLNLDFLIWKGILEKEIAFNDLKAIDINCFNLISGLESDLKFSDKDNIINKDLKFNISDSNNNIIELIQNGNEISVNIDNVKKYIELVKSFKINEFNNQIDYIKQGFYSVMPIDFVKVLNLEQLEELICGKNKIDVEYFKSITKYVPESLKNSDLIKWFWKWFENIREEDKVKYLKYVSGRTRLPPKSFNLNNYHTIVSSKNDNKNFLPHSQTCFFTLSLPNYETYDIFVSKIQSAIIECADIVDY